MTITEFLLSRIAEDDERFRKWAAGGEIGQTFRDRLLAECRAKRAIVERETSQAVFRTPVPWDEMGWDGDDLWLESGIYRIEGEEAQQLVREYSDPVTDTPTLRDLAAVYADHPDFQEEWRA